jgi:hypothetical protein
MTLDEVKACLTKDGWPIEDVSESTVRSRFRAGTRVMPLFVHVDADYATFAVIPFAALPEDIERHEDIAWRLLALNREMNMAKLSFDEDGDVVLSVEYPLVDLDPSEVRDAMDVLSFYADKFNPILDKLVDPTPS